MKIHHIGYLVKKIEIAILEFKKLGFNIIEEIIFDDIRKMYICFMKNGEYVIELINPVDKSSVAYNLLKKYKNSPYHICYETVNIEEKIESLIDNGYMLIQELCISPAIGNKRVAFLINSDIGIIELVEK